ncbi:protein turtle homolog A-like [Leptidea sinapis]|uniref:protein turtle homolog A-like n=1 Tax=Leptidea sinapis TaxID=189913 RepID=UPI0021266BE6|nr:protein turtle homolog A-like [Leptidea sinapis]
MFRVLLCVVLMLRRSAGQDVIIEESSSFESVHAAMGRAAELPCDVTPALPHDSVALIIWYKQGHQTPVYTMDTRDGVDTHWSDPSTLGARASFRTSTMPALLVLTKIRPEDSGQYRCRVDFIKSPTKNTRLNLTVLIPPERLVILDQDGEEVHGGVLGPFDEGTKINLTCVAIGGRPTARVSWWQSHALLANSEARASTTVTLQRDMYPATLTCQAVTDPSLAPLSENITVDMNLYPLWVRIIGGARPLVAGRATELVCQAVGARPHPTISWWKGATRLHTVRDKVSPDGNITSSILTLMPSVEDSGRVISCRSVQQNLKHSVKEDGWQMEVQHVPIPKLKLGANLDPNSIMEGSDVYLDCSVRANPPHQHVYFTFNGVMVKGSGGVLVSRQSLVLQHVSRERGGDYVCVGRNALGDGSSEPLHLDVKYKPVCSRREGVAIRAARGETVHIQCDVDANPMPQSYRWWFNSSTYTERELTSNTENSYRYKVNSSSEYGWVQCTGANSVGRQSEPCLFHILPADRPSALQHCDVSNVTHDCFMVDCVPGYDGGLQQEFILQVYTMDGALISNRSGFTSQWRVCNMTAQVRAHVLARNRVGTSDAVTLTVTLLSHSLRHTGTSSVNVQLSAVLVSVLCAACVLVCIATLATMVLCYRHCTPKRVEKPDKPKAREESKDLLEDKEAKDEKHSDTNPDIIPVENKLSASISSTCSVTDHSQPLLTHTQLCCGNAQEQYLVRPLQYYQHYTSNVPNLELDLNYLSTEYRLPHDKVYEDWLRYKNALPMDTSDLLPPHQLTPQPNTLYSSIKRNPLKLVKMADISGGPYTTPLHLNTEEKTARFHNVTDAPRNYCEDQAVQTQSDAATNTQLHTQR